MRAPSGVSRVPDRARVRGGDGHPQGVRAPSGVLRIPAPGVGVAVLDGIAWDDLLVVVVAGGGAGIGLSVAFALLVRGAVQAGAARREGRGSAVTANLALAAVSGSICLGAVVLAFYELGGG